MFACLKMMEKSIADSKHPGDKKGKAAPRSGAVAAILICPEFASLLEVFHVKSKEGVCEWVSRYYKWWKDPSKSPSKEKLKEFAGTLDISKDGSKEDLLKRILTTDM
jgi:hypothetical protein